MKRILLLAFVVAWSAHSGAALIKMSFAMDANLYSGSGVVRSIIPTTMIADDDLWTINSMTIEIDGETLRSRETYPALGRDAWAYNAPGVGGWSTIEAWGFSFLSGGATYYFQPTFTEGAPLSPKADPITDFFSLGESSWWFSKTQDGETAEWGLAPNFQNATREVVSVPEPATLSLLAFGLAAIGIRRRLR